MPTIMRWLKERTMARVKRGLSDRRHNPIVCPTLARLECRNSSEVFDLKPTSRGKPVASLGFLASLRLGERLFLQSVDDSSDAFPLVAKAG